jgi:hypothetical protein
MILAFLACTPEEASPAEPRLVPLEGAALARRISLDLRGVLPDADEYATAEESGVDDLTETWLEDSRLEDRLVELFAERFHTRLDRFESRYYDYLLEDDQDYEFVRSIGEEPLRLMAHVAVTDAPWTDIVTVDYTMADEMLADIWNIDYPADTSGWQESWYLDGRPAAGILATNGLWWRYVTNTSNLNRSRAAAISNLLLCNDYLARQVSLSGAAIGSDGAEEAIRTNPACVGCHVSIDPLAANLFGFYTLIGYNPDEMGNYHPDREGLGEDLLGVSPAYFGTPIGGLADLGVAVAQDPRFVRCTARNMAQALWRRPPTVDDFSIIEGYRQSFIDGGLTMRALLRAILASDTYRAGALGGGALASDEDQLTIRMMSADQLRSVVEDLTGFRWVYGSYDLLGNDETGFRVLAGGVDGETVGSPQTDPGLTWAVVVQRLAEGAAAYAVEQELVAGGDRRLFEQVTLDDRPGDPAFDEELVRLHVRLYGYEPSEERLAAASALWTDIEAESGAAEAWKGLVSGLLRDPEMVAY